MKKFLGKTLTGKIVSLHSGSNDDLSKQGRDALFAEIGGFAGDAHQGDSREAYDGDWEPRERSAGMNVNGRLYQWKSLTTLLNGLG